MAGRLENDKFLKERFAETFIAESASAAVFKFIVCCAKTRLVPRFAKAEAVVWFVRFIAPVNVSKPTELPETNFSNTRFVTFVKSDIDVQSVVSPPRVVSILVGLKFINAMKGTLTV